MWKPGEIQQQDPGQVVSDKLDSEFERIQTVEAQTKITLSYLKYADATEMKDESEAHKIVSPWGMWSVFRPLVDQFNEIKHISEHFDVQFFNGRTWLRSNVPLEYFGQPMKEKDMFAGSYITYGAFLDMRDNIYDKTLLVDGSKNMTTGYVPRHPLAVTTKEYVDNEIFSRVKAERAEYKEFPESADGASRFDMDLAGREFMVYLNGVLQRRYRYSYDNQGIDFNTPLSYGDQVTIVTIGAR